MDSQPYYGAPTDSGIQTLGERLRTYYNPEDFVTVINVDTRPIKYQFTHPSDIETFSDYPGHKDTIVKRPPQVVVLQPGESKLCPAYEADLMIENLIKQITSSKVEQSIEAGESVAWQSANWTDPQIQKTLISQIFVGKKDIIGSYNKTLEKPDVSGDLLDEPTAPARRGRPAKAA
jgi:hypothetical protein